MSVERNPRSETRDPSPFRQRETHDWAQDDENYPVIEGQLVPSPFILLFNVTVIQFFTRRSLRTRYL